MTTPSGERTEPRRAGSCNIAMHLPRMARLSPDRVAVIVPRGHDGAGRATYESITFAELEERSNRYAGGLAALGFSRGMRVLLMVRPGIEFISLTFALFKLGAPPVLIDPGMGVSRLLECVRDVRVEGFIGVPLAHVLRRLRPRAFATLGPKVTVGRRWGWDGSTLQDVHGLGRAVFEPAATLQDETAAILFTSGSTGPAKGVVYEHGMFEAQVRLIQQHYAIEPGEVDLPAFPLFALFSTAMGMSCVIPEMDPSHPARVDPARIVEAIVDHRVTNTFGSPAIWKRVAPWCIERGIKLSTLKRVLIAGAPVPPATIRQLHQVIPDDADVHTPYGATEALPVASITGRQLLKARTAWCRHSETAGVPVPASDVADGNAGPQLTSPADAAKAGAGTCVGFPMDGIEVRLIQISDDAIPEWSDELLVDDGVPGEIVVSGTVVTLAYFGRPEATQNAKIRDGDKTWHRMGDVGYRDSQGRIWFCGRKSQRVRTITEVLFADQCEAIFNEHTAVARTAIVGVGPPGRQDPVLIVERQRRNGGRQKSLRTELLQWAAAHALTRSIRTVLFHKSLPVDVRHNAKINRELLAQWAGRKLGVPHA